MSLSLLVALLGATRPPYGGEVVAYVFGAGISTLPKDQATSADCTLQRAIYESLYRFEGDRIVPNIAAELPVVDGTKIKVVLRPNLVAHDGTVVDAHRVAEWLSGFVHPESRAAFLFLAVRGARARLAEKDAELGIFAVDSLTLLFELDHPYPGFGRLLASSHAGIGVPGGAGTGPFRVANRAEGGTLTLSPFLDHFRGRPYLDRIELRPITSRFGASSIVKNERAALVFGVPDDHRTERVAFEKAFQREVIILSLGDRFIAPDRTKVLGAIDAALNRGRLRERYLGPDAEAASSFLGITGRRLEAGSRLEARATMLVSKEARAGQRFAERVQLDLHRAGVSAAIERVSPDDLEKRRRSRDYELMLDVVTPDLPRAPLAIDRLHALLSVGSSYGRPDFIDSVDLARFVNADHERQEALLPQMETLLRAELGLLPIATRSMDVSLLPILARVVVGPSGALEMQDAFLSESPR